MAGRTSRFKLSRFGGGTQGTISDEGQKYSSTDRDMIDRLLAQAEMHDHHTRPIASGPDTAAALDLQTGGSLQAGMQYFYRYSVVDANGMESVAAPVASVTAPTLLPAPAMPGCYVDAADPGALAVGQYFYAVTAVRGTEETPLGAAAQVTVVDGETAVRVTLPALGDATSFRVWRMARTDAAFTRIGVTSSAEFLDDGSVPPNPAASLPQNMPPQTNSGIANYAVAVTLPAGVDLSTAKSWRLYRAVQHPNFPTNALVHDVVERTAEWDTTSPLVRTWIDGGDSPMPGTPTSDDLNMRFRPFVLDSAAALPSPAAYPAYYPIVVDGVLYVQVDNTWVTPTVPELPLSLPSAGSLPAVGGYTEGAPIVVGEVLYVLRGGAWLKISSPASGGGDMVLTSPSGNRFVVVVDDSGALSTKATAFAGPPAAPQNVTVA